MNVVGKVWGSTACAYDDGLMHIERVTIKPMHQCSLHVHEHKANTFIVLSGRMFIDVVKEDYPLTDTTELGPGDLTTVFPGEHHRFRTGVEGCEAFEIYHLKPLSKTDIRRKGCGGPVEEGGAG